MLGMSQEKLGAAVDLTFQQIQKYERGMNRIGSSRLYDFSCVLDVPVSFFFDDMPPEVAEEITSRSAHVSTEGAEHRSDILVRRETLELVRAYYRIKDEKLRKKVYELTKTLANAAG